MKTPRILILAILLTLGAMTLGASTKNASAAGTSDFRVGQATVNFRFPCGVQISFKGSTLDVYAIHGSSMVLRSQFSANHPTTEPPTGWHVMVLVGNGSFSAPSGHDGNGDYFDLALQGTVTGPSHDFILAGTWRVWVNRGHIVRDSLLTLSTVGIVPLC